MTQQGATSGGAATRQRPKTSVMVGTGLQAVIAIAACALTWRRHGPYVAIAVLFVGAIATGGAAGYAWLSTHGFLRSDVRNGWIRRTSGYARAVLVLAAWQWIVFVAMNSTTVLHDTEGVFVFDGILLVLVYLSGLLFKIPWLVRRAERRRARPADRPQTPSEPFNSGW